MPKRRGPWGGRNWPQVHTFEFFTCALGAPMTASLPYAFSPAEPLCTHGKSHPGLGGPTSLKWWSSSMSSSSFRCHLPTFITTIIVISASLPSPPSSSSPWSSLMIVHHHSTMTLPSFIIIDDTSSGSIIHESLIMIIALVCSSLRSFINQWSFFIARLRRRILIVVATVATTICQYQNICSYNTLSTC